MFLHFPDYFSVPKATEIRCISKCNRDPGLQLNSVRLFYTLRFLSLTVIYDRI